MVIKQGKRQMKRYQFKKIVCSEYNVEHTLNEYGKYGFRSINVQKDGSQYVILMEREYEETLKKNES